MASFYGNDTGQHWQAYCEWNVTNETDDTVTISGTTYFHSIAWGFQIDYVNGRLTIDGNQNFTTNNHVETASGETKNVALVTHSVTLVKGDSPRVITINAGVRNNSTYMDGYSEGAVQYTVPAKTITTYTVSYNPNGGVGYPAPQTKTKGVTLYLSNSPATRPGYVFEGWSTSPTGTVQYKAGAAFNIDADTVLYAVWSYDRANAPQITSSSVYRVASSGSTTPSPSGNYVYFTISWESGSNVTFVSGQYQCISGMSVPMALDIQGDTTGTSGTSYGWFSASSNDRFSMIFDIQNADGQHAEAGFTIEEFGSPIIDVKNAGKGIGLLTEAPDEGVNIGGDTLSLLVDKVEKPAITVGWRGTSTQAYAHDMTNTDAVFDINTIFALSGNVSGHTRVYRTGNYVYVSIPPSDGDASDVYFVVSGQTRVDAITATNLATSIYVEHTSGMADDSDLPDTVEAGIITSPGGFASSYITPFILALPRSTNGTNLYRFSMRGRSSNSTGSVSSWHMTIRML